VGLWEGLGNHTDDPDILVLPLMMAWSISRIVSEHRKLLEV
jgi:hypothetical protein